MLCKLPNNNLISTGLILLTPTVYVLQYSSFWNHKAKSYGIKTTSYAHQTTSYAHKTTSYAYKTYKFDSWN